MERCGASYHQVHRADIFTPRWPMPYFETIPIVRFSTIASRPSDRNSHYVVAKFTNGKTYTSDVLIGCDGGTSKVRACVFGDEKVNYTGQVAFRALLPMSNVPPSVAKISYAMFVGLNRALLHYPLRHRAMMNVIGMARELSLAGGRMGNSRDD